MFLAVFYFLDFPMSSFCRFKYLKQTYYLGHVLCNYFIPFRKKKDEHFFC